MKLIDMKNPKLSSRTERLNKVLQTLFSEGPAGVVVKRLLYFI